VKLILDPHLRILTSLHATAHRAARDGFFSTVCHAPRNLEGVAVMASDVCRDGGEAVLSQVLRRTPDAVVIDLVGGADSLVCADWAQRWRYNYFIVHYNECIFGLPYWEERLFIILIRRQEGIPTSCAIKHTPIKVPEWRPVTRSSELCSVEAASWALDTVERNMHHPRSYYRTGRGSYLHVDAFRLRSGRSCWIGPTPKVWSEWPIEDDFITVSLKHTK